VSSILASLSHEIESTYIDAEIEAECYQEQYGKYEIDFDLCFPKESPKVNSDDFANYDGWDELQ
jgi:hypothetical protein